MPIQLELYDNQRFPQKEKILFFSEILSLICLPPNGLRYPLVGGTGQRHFAGANLKPTKLPENAQTPTSQVHAVLGGRLC